jgi:4a-hydroxytetrahydrobiopterin dehydratase
VSGNANGGKSRRTISALRCAPGAPRLPEAELRDRLAGLPGWELAGDRIEKSFHFRDYAETMAFVNAVAAIAQREDHHPDLSVHYDRCAVAFSTHSAGGVTLNDVICAAKVEDTLA